MLGSCSCSFATRYDLFLNLHCQLDNLTEGCLYIRNVDLLDVTLLLELRVLPSVFLSVAHCVHPEVGALVVFCFFLPLI
jgi:hypothetical protein